MAGFDCQSFPKGEHVHAGGLRGGKEGRKQGADDTQQRLRGLPVKMTTRNKTAWDTGLEGRRHIFSKTEDYW